MPARNNSEPKNRRNISFDFIKQNSLDACKRRLGGQGESSSRRIVARAKLPAESAPCAHSLLRSRVRAKQIGSCGWIGRQQFVVFAITIFQRRESQRKRQTGQRRLTRTAWKPFAFPTCECDEAIEGLANTAAIGRFEMP